MDDPFASVGDSTPDARVITGGRYRLPNRDGTHKPNGWMRVSNLVSAYADQYALRQWEQRQMMKGIRQDHGMYTTLVEATDAEVDDPQWDEAFLEKCKKVAGGSAGADHGNERHSAVEGLHFGADAAVYPSETRRMLALYSSTLARHKLTPMAGMQERIVLISQLEVCGKFDGIVVDDDGQATIGDLKTQRKFWDYLSIKAQLACYAHGEALWNAKAGVWEDMPKVRQDVGLILWMPRGAATVDVRTADIVAGWKTAQRAYRVVLDRREGGKGVHLRPAPAVTATEQYAAMFAGVDSLAEGRALTEECKRKGVWCEALADSAALAVARLGKSVVS